MDRRAIRKTVDACGSAASARKAPPTTANSRGNSAAQTLHCGSSMRVLARLSWSAFTLAACFATACASAPEPSDGDDTQAAATAASDLAPEMARLLGGNGLMACNDSLGEHTLCVHENGIVLLSDSGFAFLQGHGQDLRLAVVPIEARSADEIVGQLPSESRTDLRAQGLASEAAGIIVRAVGRILQAGKSAALRVGKTEGRALVTRASRDADELSRLTSTLARGESASLSARGVLTLAGRDRETTVRAAVRWAELRQVKVIGLRTGEPGAAVTSDMVDDIMAKLVKTRAELGGRAALLVPTTHGSAEAIARRAKELGVDVVTVGYGDTHLAVTAHIRTNALLDVADQVATDQVVTGVAQRILGR